MLDELFRVMIDAVGQLAFLAGICGACYALTYKRGNAASHNGKDGIANENNRYIIPQIRGNVKHEQF